MNERYLINVNRELEYYKYCTIASYTNQKIINIGTDYIRGR